MKTIVKITHGVAAVAILASAAFLIDTASAATSAKTVTTQTNTVAPDGSVQYEKHTVVTTGEVPVRPMTFYYYDKGFDRIVSSYELTPTIFEIWDKDNNKMIDMGEFYDNELVMYEPVEYSNRTYTDLDADGHPELTREEYTVRLTQLPMYATINSDGKDGISAYEFVGTGFQAVDRDDDNQISYNELSKAFYEQPRFASEPDLYNN